MSNVLDFGAVGDGVADDTDAVIHCVEKGDGVIYFPRGRYRITRPIEIALAQDGRTAIQGDLGVAKVVMAGPGPAFHFLGTHDGTAHPSDFKPAVWPNERMPTVPHIEVEGDHPQASAFRLEGTMQATFTGVLIRRVVNGIHLTTRNRNVLISACHIYHNTGVGVLIDHCNLHQVNIVGSHISYNRLGGIRIETSQVRNLQITGNDIEYNNHRSFDADPEPTAEIWIDTTAPGASVNEIAVASNTIQATPSPGGANIRILEKRDEIAGTAKGEALRPGLWTITGNIIGSQETNVHLTGCYGVVISGNFIYSGTNRNLLVESSNQINVTGNSFRRHTPDAGTGVRFEDSADCLITGCQMRDESDEGQVSGASLLELVRCQRFSVTGCQVLDGVPFGLHVQDSGPVSVTGCTVMDTRAKTAMQSAVRWQGAAPGAGNLLGLNTVGAGVGPALAIDADAQVKQVENVNV